MAWSGWSGILTRDSTGAFTGSLSGRSPPPLAEAHLAFTVTVLRETLLNPARPPLFQVGFAREASSTSLLDPGDPRAFQLLLNPTLSDDPNPASLLRINGLALHAYVDRLFRMIRGRDVRGAV